MNWVKRDAKRMKSKRFEHWPFIRLRSLQTDKMAGREAGWLTNWRADKVTDCQSERRAPDRQTIWQAVIKLTDWKAVMNAGWQIGKLLGWHNNRRRFAQLTSRQASWWTKISRGWQIDKLTRCQADKLIGWQTDMLTSWQTIRVIDGLSDRLPIWQVSGWQIERVSEGCRLANWQVVDRTVWLSKWQANTCTS